MEKRQNRERFVGYEYKEVTIKKNYVSLYIDSYENFGWIFEKEKASLQKVGSQVLEFKRDRMIRNKAELTRLQRQFDSIIEEIEYLERNKTLKASVIAYILGVIGCAFIAASVFAITYALNIPLMIVLSVPGFICWMLSYILYVRIKMYRTQEIAPLIEDKYDKAYEVTKRASALIAD